MSPDVKRLVEGGNIGTDDHKGKQEDTGRGRELDTSGEDKRVTVTLGLSDL